MMLDVVVSLVSVTIACWSWYMLGKSKGAKESDKWWTENLERRATEQAKEAFAKARKEAEQALDAYEAVRRNGN